MKISRGSAPLLGPDDAALFEFVHDAGGAGVAQTQAALHQGDARFLFAADDFDALLDEVLVFVAAAFASNMLAGLESCCGFPLRSSACPVWR